MAKKPEYKQGDVVWLRAFEESPREKCTLSGPPKNGMCIGFVKPTEQGDDGLREFDVDQIEGRA